MCVAPAALGAQAPRADLLAGQELIYSGRFDSARAHFAALASEHPRDAAPLALAATALIWSGAARNDDDYQADTIDVLLDRAIALASAALDSAKDDTARVSALFWLGSAYGSRARQADLHGRVWRAMGDAKGMRNALKRAVAIDSSCVDCRLGLGAIDYGLARENALARLVAKIVGLGGSNAERGLAQILRCTEACVFMRTEARWLYANAMLRETDRDPTAKERGERLIAELAQQFPDNPVFQRARASEPASP
jgi:tetratricopeptide (TPR) repeat protein